MAKTSTKVLKPETLRKKSYNKLTAEKKKEIKKNNDKVRYNKFKAIYSRAKKYETEYARIEKDKKMVKIRAEKKGHYYVPAQPKLAFVVRIKGINKIAPKPRKIMQLLRLLQINNGTFVRLTKATKEMLTLIEPYVTYGEPSRRNIKKLLYKRGYGKIDGQRIRLSDNKLIEAKLGKFGIICIEDILHEIYTVGPNFKQVNNFLWPFKLNTPNGGWKGKKSKHFVEGGEGGDRERYINEVLERMI